MFKFNPKNCKRLFQFNNQNLSSYLVKKETFQDILLRRQKRQPDRFGIAKCKTLEDLYNVTQNPRNKLTLNEYIMATYRITEIVDNAELEQIYGADEMFQHVRRKLKDLQQEDPLIGKCSHTFKIFGKYKSLETWVDLQDYILQDVFDSEHDEILHSLIGFDDLLKHLKEEWQVELFWKCMDKIELNLLLNLKLSKYDLQEMKKIINLLYKNERFQNQELYEEIEYQLLKIAKLQYQQQQNQEEDQQQDQEKKPIQKFLFEDLTQFGYCFTSASYHGEQLFNFSKFILQHQIGQNIDNFEASGLAVAQFIGWWNYFSERSPENAYLDEEIKNWLKIKIFQTEFQYNMFQINAINRSLQELDIFDKSKYIEYLQEQQLMNIQGEVMQQTKLQDVQNYLEFRGSNEFDDIYQNIPKKVFQKLDFIASEQIMSFNYIQIYFFIQMLEEKEILEFFPYFFQRIGEFLVKYIDDVQFDEMCYFYVVLTLNSHVISDVRAEGDTSFWSNVNTIKSHIKFVSMRRGFKIGKSDGLICIDMESHFHRLLNVVDLAEFFDGGEM